MPPGQTGSANLPAVCLISPQSDSYTETFIRTQIERLPARVEVLTGGYVPVFYSDGRPLSHIRWLARRASRANLPPAARRLVLRLRDWPLESFLRRRQFKLVLAEYGPTGASVLEACIRAGTPLLVHFHGFDAWDHATLQQYAAGYQRVFREAAALIAVSRPMVQQLIELGAPAVKVHYCPYGVDTRLFLPGDPAHAPPIFVSVGRLVDKKAPLLTLMAFKQVHERFPLARLVYVGDGPLWEAAKQLARALNLTGAVEFPGPRPPAEVAGILRGARAFVLHSMQASYGDSEGMPNVILEAGACGLPVVSTRHAGIPEVVEHGVTGFLVEEADVDGMARCMLQLAESPALAAQMGQAARARIEASFTVEHSIGRLWTVMESVSRK